MASDNDRCIICGAEMPEGYGMVCSVCERDETKPIVEYRKGDVVQFIENHKWCGCLGIVEDVKRCGEDMRYLVGVPTPQQGTAYIFVMKNATETEYIGRAIFVSGPPEDKG